MLRKPDYNYFGKTDWMEQTRENNYMSKNSDHSGNLMCRQSVLSYAYIADVLDF